MLAVLYGHFGVFVYLLTYSFGNETVQKLHNPFVTKGGRGGGCLFLIYYGNTPANMVKYTKKDNLKAKFKKEDM